MQQLITVPTIKTTLVAAAITIASLTMMGGTASASSMDYADKNGNDHNSQKQHENGQQDGHENAQHWQRDQQEERAKAQHASQNAHENRQTNETKQEGDQQSQAAIDLRVGMNNLLAGHVTTNLNVNRAIVSNAMPAELEAAMQTQVVNSEALAAAIGSIYGAEAQAQFYTMFQEHIDESNKYAMAVADGDESAKIAANAELQRYLGELSTFFSTAIPVLAYEDVYALLNRHEELINQSTEAFATGDYAGSYYLGNEALMQVATIADALAAGIVTTQPDLF